MIDHPPRVFISYAQESDSHSAWVLGFAQRLRQDGVDAVIDRYFTGLGQGWRPWMAEQLERAEWVLVVCTQGYADRIAGKVPADRGQGVPWEWHHITQTLYDDKLRNERFVAVLPRAGDAGCIPLPLKGYAHFRLDDDYEALYRLLTEQPATPAPKLGAIRYLPALEVPATAPESLPGEIALPPPAIANPYPGLAAFKPAECPFFFGRQADTARVMARLEQTRFVSVVGRSGTGKSSLVAAGVEPALRERKPPLTYLPWKPRSDPYRQLAEALDRALPVDRSPFGESRADEIRQALENNPLGAVSEHLGALQAPVLLFADQFEELFTQTPPAAAERFRELIDVLRAHPAVYVVLTLRSEFMPRLADWLGAELFETSLLVLDPIRDEDRLREIIVRPAAASGVGVQEQLLQELLAAARAMAGALPLLALALAQLFARRDPIAGLTLASYRDMGGLQKVVESALAPIDRRIDRDPALSQACERLFAELATVIDDLPTRRTAAVEGLRVDANLSRLVEALRGQGLLADPDDRHVELAHETLLIHWPRLHAWCGQYSDKLALRRQTEQAAGDWQKARAREKASGQPATARRSDLLRWTWERQKPALEALLALHPQLAAAADADFADAGIAAWRGLTGSKLKPLKRFLAPEPWRLLHELRTDKTPQHRREEIGLRLNSMGDPRRGVGLDAEGLPDLVWVDIPAGQVTLETDPLETVAVPAFRIARYPITWRQYRAFIDAADGYREARWWDGLKHADQPGDDRWGFANYPAINVSWYDAVAFCRWLSHRLRPAQEQIVRLPTEGEWQWVAQAGTTASEYPWPGGWNAMRANSHKSGIGRTTAVGMYPLGAPAGWPVLDLAGNVWEWCLNPYEKPGLAASGKGVSRVLRGGSWNYVPMLCRAVARYHYAPDLRDTYVGFRVCLGSPIEPLGAAPLTAETLSR